jgi:phosphate transport system substrate-binding protein
MRTSIWEDQEVERRGHREAESGRQAPATDITVVHRSDGSGTTFIFVDYLSKVSPDFKSTVGVNTSVSWPVGVGGKGNEGVAGLVSQAPGRSATSS